MVNNATDIYKAKKTHYSYFLNVLISLLVGATSCANRFTIFQCKEKVPQGVNYSSYIIAFTNKILQGIYNFRCVRF
jgi:hypothetical protein